MIGLGLFIAGAIAGLCIGWSFGRKSAPPDSFGWDMRRDAIWSLGYNATPGPAPADAFKWNFRTIGVPALSYRRPEEPPCTS